MGEEPYRAAGITGKGQVVNHCVYDISDECSLYITLHYVFHAILYHSIPFYTILYNALLWYAMICYAILCYAMI